MKKIQLLLIIVVMVLSACYNTKTIVYKGPILDSIGHFKKHYIDIPRNGRLLKDKNTGDFHTEYRIIYPDSLIVYITNDTWSGSRLNYYNRMQIGIDGYTKKHLLDTLKNEGVQQNDLCWQEYILGEIVVGYVNCPPEKKKEYDSVIKTIRTIK